MSNAEYVPKSIDKRSKNSQIVASKELTEQEIVSINERLDELAGEYYDKYF